MPKFKSPDADELALPAQSLKPVDAESKSVLLQNDLAAAEDYLRHQHARATERAYRADWKSFAAWCDARGVATLPATPETVALYLSHEGQAGRAVSTIGRRAAAIRLAHRAAEFDPPTAHESVRAVLRGIRRKHRDRVGHQKAPALAAEIKAMVARIDTSNLVGKRDYALLLLGFASACRRSELAALTVADLEFTPRGLRLYIRHSKGDQEGVGQTVAIIAGAEHCPIKAVRSWLDAASISEGPIFRRFYRGGHVGQRALNPATVAEVVKRHIVLAGLDPDLYAGHSLRSGFLTSAAMNGASLFKLQEVSRHKSLETLRSYVKKAEEFEDHAGDGLL